MKLLFSTTQDIAEPWGKLRFGATPLRMVSRCEDPGIFISCCLPGADGTWEVYGSAFDGGKSGYPRGENRSVQRIMHATTRDGISYENVNEVFATDRGPWGHYLTVTHNPETGGFLALTYRARSYGFEQWVLLSPDGRRWTESEQNPVYADGDSWGVLWSPKARRFVVTTKCFQKVVKHIPDHGKIPGGEVRRVCSVRHSLDGRRWEPSDRVHIHAGELMPDGLLVVPDEDDPPDLEFYRGVGFGYHDRCFLLMLNYAGSPLMSDRHGPQLDTEWWVSSDGLKWERPYRDTHATPDQASIVTIRHNPLIIGGKLLFHCGNEVLGMEEDRISYVGARSNAEFSTVPFEMPAAELSLNSAVPSPERAFAAEQAYLMVGVVDEQGRTIPGFEPEGCLVRNENRIDIPLVWNGQSPRRLAGQRVRLRFRLRSANVYAVRS